MRIARSAPAFLALSAGLAAMPWMLALGIGACVKGPVAQDAGTSTGSGGSGGASSATDTGGKGGGSGGSSASGGISGNGGSESTGGASGSGGGGGSGGAPDSGGVGGRGGAGGGDGGASGGTSGRASWGPSGSSGTSAPDAAPDVPVDSGPPPIVYRLPPPNQSTNTFFIQGCQSGVATSPGGGNCTPAQNACEGTKPGAQVQFLCPRFMLFSDEMAQAASDDGNVGLNYGVVGHDVDTGGIDGNENVSCCQCYQLVFKLPENVAQVNGNGAAAIPIPPSLVVQSFNTAAGGGKNFDVFMGAGGFGAFNACDPNASSKSPSGKYFYTQFPSEGEPGSGGVNAATQIPACSSKNLVTTATLSSSSCQTAVATACGKFKASVAGVTDESIRSCTESNDADSYYHMNWQIYAKRVECPTHLMEVTGCKLAPLGLPAVNPAVKTPEQAAADSSFKSGYTITTMQDCCMPTCAWRDNVTARNVKVTGQYNSFYSCDGNGAPVTEPAN